MTEISSIWEKSPSLSSLISIRTHRLFASVCGPVRRARGHSSSSTAIGSARHETTYTWTDDPIIIVFPGAGESSSSWPRVQESVSRFARILTYDRTGLGRSEQHVHMYTDNKGAAIIAAEELCALLDAAQISGQYILVAHSYGAIVAREFLNMRLGQVAGMVLVDGSTERQPQYFSLPNTDITAVLGDLKFSAVTGLKANAQLSPEEWKKRAIEMSQGAQAVQAEIAAYEEVCKQLAEKEQFKRKVLSDRPLSVIKCCSSQDYERIYEAGLKAGYGTKEQRQAFRNLLDKWDSFSRELQQEQLQLSSRSRWIEIPDCGHNINILRPDVIVHEIQWVLDCVVNDDSHL